MSHAQIRIHLGAHFFLALPVALLLHSYTHKLLSTGGFFDDVTHIPTLDDLHKHKSRGAFLFMLTGAFPLDACSVTRNLRT